MTEKQRQGKNPYLPTIIIDNGTLESLKWLALGLMVIDHANKYLYHEASRTLFNLGRISMPLFVFVLAYNLARAGMYERGAHIRILKRLALYGMLATPAFIGLGGLLSGWWPLNILFTLFVMTGIIYCLEKKTKRHILLGAVLFLFGGSVVEFWQPALLFGIGAWGYHIRHDKNGDIWTRSANYHSRTYRYNSVYRADLIRKALKWADWLDARFATYDVTKQIAKPAIVAERKTASTVSLNTEGYVPNKVTFNRRPY